MNPKIRLAPNIEINFSGHTDSVSRLEFSVDGKLLATGGMEGVVKIWDVETGNHVADLEGPGDSIEVPFLPYIL
jgi:WD40 repeat protein